jgi:DNA-binding MarR family transcriptional regulator
MFDFLMRTAPERTRELGRHALTPNDSRALASLDRTTGRRMRELAHEWQCDASHATGIIDRLERMGLAERRVPPDDRRVKLVVLTAKGGRTRDALLAAFHEPPAELLALPRAALTALERALRPLNAVGASSARHIRT